MANVLIISPPVNSPVMAVSRLTATALYRVLKRQGHTVRRIRGPFVERGVIEWWLKLTKRDEKLLCYFGHGLPSEMIGNEEYQKVPGFTPVLDIRNTSYLENCVVYSCSCWTGADLGLSAEESAIAYMGFNRPVFVFFNKEDHDYMNDWINMFTVFPILVANGTSVRDSYAAFRRKCNDYISYYNSVALDLNGDIGEQLKEGGKIPNADYFLSRTINNRDGAMLFGDWDYEME